MILVAAHAHDLVAHDVDVDTANRGADAAEALYGARLGGFSENPVIVRREPHSGQEPRCVRSPELFRATHASKVGEPAAQSLDVGDELLGIVVAHVFAKREPAARQRCSLAIGE